MWDAFFLVDVDHDTFTGYDPYGRLSARWHVDDEGLLHGRTTTWTDGNRHRMASSKQWQHGYLHGDTEYFDDEGRRYLKIVFSHGKPITFTYYCVHSQEPIFTDGATDRPDANGKWWRANFVPRGMASPRATLGDLGPATGYRVAEDALTQLPVARMVARSSQGEA